MVKMQANGSQKKIFSLSMATRFYNISLVQNKVFKFNMHFLFTHLFYLLRAWGQMMLYHMLE